MKKKLKEEKGITGIDIIVSVIIITMFVAIIAIIFSNITSNSKGIDRKTEATYKAISLIEEIKNAGIENVDKFIDAEGSSILDEEKNPTPYTKKVTVIDYTKMEGNEDKKHGIVKKVTVEVSYQNGGKTEKVELSTLLTAKEIGYEN